MRRGGLEVDLSVSADELPSSIATLVFRVVQEGLTNAVRHGDARRARVEVHESGRAVVVRVHDDGTPTGAASNGSGRGLAGLRRRLELFDASLAAGPDGGGWLLDVRIPLEEAAR